MKVLGLITEYNPLHNGHIHHLVESKKITGATHTIAVMSGNFLQRGEPAIVHKWARAQMAVSSGIDLVIEIPTVYACATAELFAFGAVTLLNGLGVVDYLCFGTELGELDLLFLIKEVLLRGDDAYKASIKSYMDKGYSYYRAREESLLSYLKYEKKYDNILLSKIQQTIKNPNNILGLEYLKALDQTKSTIIPYTIQRKKASYHSKTIDDSRIASATAIREYIYKNENNLEKLNHVIPPLSKKLLIEAYEEQGNFVFSECYNQALLALLRRSSCEDLQKIFDVSEGLENRILHCALQHVSFRTLCQCIKTKRYSLTRIQRILFHFLLNITKQNMVNFTEKGGSQYARILAFNNKGREILQACKSKATIPVISNIKYFTTENDAAQQMLSVDIRATNLYTLGCSSHSFSTYQLDYKISPFYLK